MNGPLSAENILHVEGPISLIGNFKISTFNISYQTEGNGTTIGPVTYTVEDIPTAKAISSNGWNFNGWYGNDLSYLASPTSSESLIQWNAETPPKNLSFLAKFTPEQYSVQVFTLGLSLIHI